MMPLNFANIGDVNIIKKISGTSAQKQHLNDLGFVQGADVSVISKVQGNVIVLVKNSRIAISKELAMKIMV